MPDACLRAPVSSRGVVAIPEAGLPVRKPVTDDERELSDRRFEENESMIDGLRREVDEETGLCIDVPAPGSTPGAGSHTVAHPDDRRA